MALYILRNRNPNVFYQPIPVRGYTTRIILKVDRPIKFAFPIKRGDGKYHKLHIPCGVFKETGNAEYVHQKWFASRYTYEENGIEYSVTKVEKRNGNVEWRDFNYVKKV